jgi:5-formyltetrahydrofolate cyclo-ligase
MEQFTVQDIRRNLRAHLLQARDALAKELRHRLSEKITEQLWNYVNERPCRSIHCYISFRSEVETQPFIIRSLENGLRVTVPIVQMNGAAHSLAHSEIQSLSDLAGGAFGLQEPAERIPATLDMLDMVIVPLVGFDRKGTRLGYGMGFYDAFLHELPRAIERVGLAFGIQEAEFIPILPHDEPLDTIITEHEIIHVH